MVQKLVSDKPLIFDINRRVLAVATEPCSICAQKVLEVRKPTSFSTAFNSLIYSCKCTMTFFTTSRSTSVILLLLHLLQAAIISATTSFDCYTDDNCQDYAFTVQTDTSAANGNCSGPVQGINSVRSSVQDECGGRESPLNTIRAAIGLKYTNSNSLHGLGRPILLYQQQDYCNCCTVYTLAGHHLQCRLFFK